MNFLAHIHLSGENKDLRFGNFIADAIRGKAYEKYPFAIQKGIHLHRKIDHFTDTHPTFRSHCRLFSPQHGHYARVIMDVLYDHLLAKNWSHFHTISLEEFAQGFYEEIRDREDLLPPKMQPLFSTMKKQNWLLQYQTIEGLEHILYHMSKRTRFPSNFVTAIPLLLSTYPNMLPAFLSFYRALETATENDRNCQP